MAIPRPTRIQAALFDFDGTLADTERLGVELAVSTDAGFVQYATMIRAVERFGVVVDDKDAVISLSINTGA